MSRLNKHRLLYFAYQVTDKNQVPNMGFFMGYFRLFKPRSTS